MRMKDKRRNGRQQEEGTADHGTPRHRSLELVFPLATNNSAPVQQQQQQEFNTTLDPPNSTQWFTAAPTDDSFDHGLTPFPASAAPHPVANRTAES